MTPSRRRARAKQSGYTLVEVMIAIAILTASGVAILGMQETVIRGNIEARQMATATSIARSTLELLRMDALNWTTSVPSAGTFSTTQFLRTIPIAATAAPTAWAPLGTIQGTRDYHGMPTAVAANMEYCVQTRFAWIFSGQLVRADVRVWWPRVGADRAAFVGCPNQTGMTAGLLQSLHFVESSTELRWTPAPL